MVAQSVACWNGSAWEARSLPPPPDLGFPPRHGFWNIGDLQRDPADGSLVVGGDFRLDLADTTKGGGIARWTGSEWELIGDGVMEHGPGSSGQVNAIAFTSNGLYVGGRFRFANAALDPITEVNDAARWDGTRWHTLDAGLFATAAFGIGERPAAVNAIAATPNGASVFFGGPLHRAGAMAVDGVVRWDGTSFGGLHTPGERTFGLSGEARAFARRGTCEVYVGGRFTYAGEVRAGSVARFTPDGGYEALGEGLVGTVEAIQVTRAGMVYASGNFTDPNGTALRNLAMWNGLEWLSVGGGVGNPADPFETARALAIGEGLGPGGGDLVYVGGHITRAGSEPFSGLGVWNGSEWTDLGLGLRGHELPHKPGEYEDPHILALLIDPATGDLVVGGSFSAIGDGDARIETSNVARWDGSDWHAYGDGAGDRENPVSAMTLWNNRLAIARTGTPDDPLRFAVWNGTEWEPVGTNQPAHFFPYAIEGVGSALFVAGSQNASGHLAAFDGTAWGGLGDGANDATFALLPIEGGVLVGGAFARAGETDSRGIAFWQYAK